jgi:hypothetical protein
MPKKPTDAGQLKLRLTDALREKLEHASDKSGRSLNNEIVWRLEQSFDTVSKTGDPIVDRFMQSTELRELVTHAVRDALVHGLRKGKPK